MTKSGIKGLLAATIGASLMALSSAAAAAFIATISGNDCSGVFNGEDPGFSNCVIPANYDPPGDVGPLGNSATPVIIKFEVVDEVLDTISPEISSFFPSIDGSEFAFTFSRDNLGIGQWTYTPDDDEDPGINFFVAKASNEFNLFSVDIVGLGEWITPLNNQEEPRALSHITFYDTGGGGPPTEIPEPGTLLLLGSALAAVGLRRRLRA